MALPYCQVPLDEDEEARGREEEDGLFLSEDDDLSGAHTRPLPFSAFRKHQILILRCHLLASLLIEQD
jgi:hypothetical protein